jgi:hypothetical protein
LIAIGQGDDGRRYGGPPIGAATNLRATNFMETNGYLKWNDLWGD